jgi:MFS family permease
VIIVGLLIFALGSFVAAYADRSLGRHPVRPRLQGAGAISAAVTALLADLTREEKRTQAMAMIGSTIGLAFAFSLAASPVFYRWIGVPGMFALTGVLALLAILVVKFVTPESGQDGLPLRCRGQSGPPEGRVAQPELLRLNWGIFALHAAQMAMFIVVPFALVDGGLDAQHHWQVYLPVLLGSWCFWCRPSSMAKSTAA